MTSTILMFSGQGSQSVGMGKDIAESFREFTQTLEEASDHLGYNMKTLLWEDPQSQLNLTEFTQPAILTMSTGLFRVLRERAGVKAEWVAGHSLGEYSALVAAGAMNFGDALKAVRFRGQSMQKAVPVGVGGMAAYIGANGPAVVEICQQEWRDDHAVEAVNFNSPSQIVLSGHKTAVERVCQLISEKKLGKGRILPVSAPFHSSLMKPAADAMRDYLAGVSFQGVTGHIVANVDARTYTNTEYTRDHLVRQVASAVLWTQTLQNLESVSEGKQWIEVGPGTVLQGLLKQTLVGREALGTGSLDALKATISKF
jgi:[acyl-carrier-protein] S-malonyltransferase